MRVLGALAIAILIAGCSSTPARPSSHENPDGWTVTAVRVIPLEHPVEWVAHLVASPCVGLLRSCPGDPGTVAELESLPAELRVHEPTALFWRLGMNVAWQKNGVADAVHLTISTFDANGSSQRDVVDITSQHDFSVPWHDVFLETGETGLRVRVEAPAEVAASSGFQRDVHLHGLLAAYVPAPA